MMNKPKLEFNGKDQLHRLAVLCAVVSMAVVVIGFAVSQAIGITGNLGGIAPAITGLVVYAITRYALVRSENKWR